MLVTIFKLIVVVIAVAITAGGTGMALTRSTLFSLASLIPAFIASMIMTALYFNQSGEMVTMWPFLVVGAAMAVRWITMFYGTIPPRIIDMPTAHGPVLNDATITGSLDKTPVGAGPRHWIAG